MDLKLTRITLLPLFVGIAVACTPVPRRIPEGLQEVAAVTVLQTPQQQLMHAPSLFPESLHLHECE